MQFVKENRTVADGLFEVEDIFQCEKCKNFYLTSRGSEEPICFDCEPDKAPKNDMKAYSWLLEPFKLWKNNIRRGNNWNRDFFKKNKESEIRSLIRKLQEIKQELKEAKSKKFKKKESTVVAYIRYKEEIFQLAKKDGLNVKVKTWDDGYV
jgi:hypothetical protein